MKPLEAFSDGQIFTHLPVNSICPIMIIFSLTSNSSASKALCEMRENMYCAKMSKFTVYLKGLARG